MNSDIPPPDLELRVRTAAEHGRTRLAYVLHSPAGVAPFSDYPITGPAFQGSPEEFHSRLLHQIEELGTGLDVDGTPVLRDEVQNKITGLGRSLWQQLFNEEMRQAYRRFRKSVRTLLILSDEPSMPSTAIPTPGSSSGTRQR